MKSKLYILALCVPVFFSSVAHGVPLVLKYINTGKPPAQITCPTFTAASLTPLLKDWEIHGVIMINGEKWGVESARRWDQVKIKDIGPPSADQMTQECIYALVLSD